MAEQQEKPPVLPYRPADPAEPPPLRRMMVGFLRVLPWLGMYAVMLLGVVWLVLARLFGSGNEPFTFGRLLADLFIAWLVLGLCVTVVRFLRRRR